MWDQAVVTNAGKALLQQWVGGGTLTIDGARSGAGAVSQLNLINQTAVTQEKQTLSIISTKQVEGGTQFHVQITAPDAGYTAKQIGIYGHLGSGDSTLIALYQDESGITVPSKAEMPDFVYAFYATIQGSNTGTLSVTLDTSALVTQATLDAAVAKAGDMKKSVYDADDDGVVDNAKKLDGKTAAQFAAASHSHAMSEISGLPAQAAAFEFFAATAQAEIREHDDRLDTLQTALNGKTDTTYTLSITDRKIILTPNSGDAQQIEIPLATASALGLVKIGTGLAIAADGTISNAYSMSYADGVLDIYGP